MNKRDVILFLENKRDRAVENMEYYKSSPVVRKMNEVRVCTYDIAINKVEQIDESSSVHKIPKDLADYFDKNPDEPIDELLSWDYLTEDNQETIQRWLYDDCTSENNKRYALACQAYVEGYEAEAEPMYRIVLPTTIGDTSYLVKVDGDTITTNGCAYYDWGSYVFTEQEIKSIDERYWQFAVPVEEEGR